MYFYLAFGFVLLFSSTYLASTSCEARRVFSPSFQSFLQGNEVPRVMIPFLNGGKRLLMMSSKYIEISIKDTIARIMSSFIQIMVMVIIPSININDLNISISIIMAGTSTSNDN